MYYKKTGYNNLTNNMNNKKKLVDHTVKEHVVKRVLIFFNSKEDCDTIFNLSKRLNNINRRSVERFLLDV
jgi:superfamily II DNA/RNA helicase